MTTSLCLRSIFLCLNIVGALFFVGHVGLGASSDGWQKIELAGETLCGDGSPYSIFVHYGQSDRLIFDFMGGGACWNAETCNPQSGLYTGSLPDVLGKWLPQADGIYNRLRIDNPFRNDTHVLIPYCTGDIHWGNFDASYMSKAGQRVSIHHRGAVNAKAAIDTVFDHIMPDPKNIFVTGCSAGSYGSIWWTPYIKREKPESQVIQFGDSGAGILTDKFRSDGFSAWHIERSAPRWIPRLDPIHNDLTKLRTSELYNAISHEYPDTRLSQYNFLNDVIQRFFYHTMGGDSFAWAHLMRGEMESIEASGSNHSYFIAPWDGHCILPYENFYSSDAQPVLGQTFPLWFQAILSDKTPPNERCSECEEDRP